jgi:ABC-2 type transport system permease protein
MSDVPQPPVGAARAVWVLRDGRTLVRRELAQIRHRPGQLLAAVILPGLMVVLFGYVFGSAIDVPGGNYREYLLPGLFAMSALSGVGVSALLISKDVNQGVMDRFRSLPMSRAAVPAGRAGADVVSAALSIVIMMVIGLLVGWRAHHGLGSVAVAFGLIVLLRYAVSWVGIVVGLSVSPEAADALVPIVFPIVMISNSFVPTEGMPGWLQAIADWNPVSALVEACRELFGNTAGVAPGAAWPLQHAVAATLGWSLALLVVFVPLATWRYRRAGR